MLQVLAIIFAAIGVIIFFLYASSAFASAVVILLSMLASAGIMYALGEIASDIREVTNILRVVHADKLNDNNSEPFDGEKLM